MPFLALLQIDACSFTLVLLVCSITINVLKLSERGKAFHKPLGAAAGEPFSKCIEKQEIPYNPAHLDLTLFGGVMQYVEENVP